MECRKSNEELSTKNRPKNASEMDTVINIEKSLKMERDPWTMYYFDCEAYVSLKVVAGGSA